MEKNIKRYTVTTVLEYDREGDVVREERCEDTEYFEPESEPKLSYTPFDGYVDYPIGNPITHPYITYSSNPVVPTTPSGKTASDLLRDYTNL